MGDRKEYQRTIHLRDTDGAGVVYFAQYFQFCHEAYEESLTNFGLCWPQLLQENQLALPIVHSAGDFLRPLFWGDRIRIELHTEILKAHLYQVHYQIFPQTHTPQNSEPQAIGQFQTRHLCIHSPTRKTHPLPPIIKQWLEYYGKNP